MSQILIENENDVKLQNKNNDDEKNLDLIFTPEAIEQIVNEYNKIIFNNEDDEPKKI